jgi:nucleotide-binding universal stress UspA family protein
MVIGVDRSATSHDAFSYALDIARAMGAHVHLVTAFAETSSPPAGGVTEDRKAAEHLLDRLASEVDPTGAKVSSHALPDKPVDAILQVAEEVGADLIVVGNKNAQGVRRVLGSVAAAVTAGAPCSVIVVKTV